MKAFLRVTCWSAQVLLRNLNGSPVCQSFCRHSPSPVTIPISVFNYNVVNSTARSFHCEAIWVVIKLNGTKRNKTRINTCSAGQGDEVWTLNYWHCSWTNNLLKAINNQLFIRNNKFTLLLQRDSKGIKEKSLWNYYFVIIIAFKQVTGQLKKKVMWWQGSH